MLRDYIHTLDRGLIKEVFSKFLIELPDGESGVTLIQFKVLSPDSFVWKFSIAKSIYYLYAEDFVSGIEDIRLKLSYVAPESSKFDFVLVKDPNKFEESSPVKASTIYAKPEDSAKMMEYAVESGHDFVFLARSDEDVNDAFFC